MTDTTNYCPLCEEHAKEARGFKQRAMEAEAKLAAVRAWHDKEHTMDNDPVVILCHLSKQFTELDSLLSDTTEAVCVGKVVSWQYSADPHSTMFRLGVEAPKDSLQNVRVIGLPVVVLKEKP